MERTLPPQTISKWDVVQDAVAVIVRYYFILVMWLFIVNVFVKALQYTGLIDPVNYLLPSYIQNSPNKPLLLFYIVLLGPVMEELAFRLSLSYKKIYLVISIPLIWFYVSYFFRVQSPQIMKPLVLVIAIAMPFALYQLLKKDEQRKGLVESFWRQNQNAVFSFSVLIFAAIHLTSYQAFSLRQLPIVLAPYILYGYYLGKLRQERGIVYSTALHILINFTAGLPYMF